MPAHKHIISSLFGAPVNAIPAGTREPDRLYTPYQEILLGPNGDVSFRRNAPSVDGYNNNLPWPGQAPVGVQKAW